MYQKVFNMSTEAKQKQDGRFHPVFAKRRIKMKSYVIRLEGVLTEGAT